MLLKHLGALACAAATLTAGDNYRISGPFTHDNLTVYLLHTPKPQPAGKTYLPLTEAIASKKVIVHETANVNQLAIENVSGQDVFIQSGDIVKGGQQDRVLKDDLILQSHSGRVPIDAFCVEHGRWSKRGAEEAKQFTSSKDALPAKALKLAVRQKADQNQVWAEVANSQAKLGRAVGMGSSVAAPASPTSMQLTIENKAVRDSAEAYVKAVTAAAAIKGDTVGFAYAINGKINSADVYGSPALFVSLWPKLLKAAAVEAVSERDSKASAPLPPAPAAVNTWMVESESGPAKPRDVGARAQVLTKDSKAALAQETKDKSNAATVHKSYVAK